MLSNISKSKGNQRMKHGQLVQYIVIFFQEFCRKWDRETSFRLVSCYFFKNCLIWGKSSWSADWFQYISIALNLGYNKRKLYKAIHYWSRDMLNFNFSLISMHFVYDFSRKMFLKLYSISWSNLIVWLPLLLKILGNMCITIIC